MNEKIKTIQLDENSREPLYTQLADSLSALMEGGDIKKDERLPSVRDIAGKLGINNGTAAAAYKLLETRRDVYTKRGSGTFCRGNSPRGVQIGPVKEKGVPCADVKADLTKTSVSETLFPVRRFADIFNAVLERDMGAAFSYQSTVGYEPLRKRLVELLEEKAIKTSAERVQIISGSQQGIDLVARAVLQQGDVVFCEEFTYLGAVNAMLSRGAAVEYLPMDSGGLRMDGLEDKIRQMRPRLIYTMPCFHTPTGISWSTERKRALLELAYKYGFYIIEEDNVGDFNYTSARITPLKALDYKNRVIYIKGFSKILMPGLRLGYAVLPREISESIAELKYSTDISTSGFIQRAFDLFIRGSGWRKHKSEIVEYFAKKYDLIYTLAQKHLSDHFDISDPKGGLILWLKLKNGGDADEFCRAFAAEGIKVISGGFYTADERSVPCIALSFADISDEDITFAAETMGRVCRRM